ncbi:hypothetical protein [Streptococcus acidominimus]|uniref:hypothetical protein n=1 Tax=Streptococcus acidominimus TaxID=1326 RepID=UPI001431D5EA|nr:hypothetical protein [Streptococcus acidominimus]MBF0819861.1 hypothetical protein [Streptococcus acidominimus]MBF0839418.1 hypothetical protein [Streptococcus acidominimus]MBF0847166.1 hypothetical protein [Streptococcus danieliae]
MSKFTNHEHMEIAMAEYNSYEIGKDVRISNDTQLVGYVSEIEDTASGFQAYVVVEA